MRPWRCARSQTNFPIWPENVTSYQEGTTFPGLASRCILSFAAGCVLDRVSVCACQTLGTVCDWDSASPTTRPPCQQNLLTEVTRHIVWLQSLASSPSNQRNPGCCVPDSLWMSLQTLNQHQATWFPQHVRTCPPTTLTAPPSPAEDMLRDSDHCAWIAPVHPHWFRGTFFGVECAGKERRRAFHCSPVPMAGINMERRSAGRSEITHLSLLAPLDPIRVGQPRPGFDKLIGHLLHWHPQTFRSNHVFFRSMLYLNIQCASAISILF